MVYLDRYIASWVVLGIVIGIGLGIMVGGLIPIPWVTHYRTVTIANSTTITIPINTTKTVTYTTTTTVGGKIETVTMTTTYIETTTTTRVVNNTVTKIIVVPTTTTVTNVSTTYIPYPYTTTVTTTVIENASQPLPLNLTNLNETITWLKASYSLSAYGLVNLTLPLGYCEATIWVFPNASVIWIGVWFMPWSLAQKLMSEPWIHVFPFQKTGVNEYLDLSSPIGILYPDFYTGGIITTGSAPFYFLNIPNYPMNGYTVAVIGWPITGVPVPPASLVNTGIYQNLQNGTYIMILDNGTTILNKPLTQIALNPQGLCVVQVIRVKPGTPDSYINNMTFLGAQYAAWILTQAAWGKPAPCYWPAGWTYGYWVWNLNITEPIGSNWAYYCAPSKGVWYPMKP
jgi:hypothetical protein